MPNLNPMHAIFTLVPLVLSVVLAVLAIWALILAIKALRKYLSTPVAPRPTELPGPPPQRIEE